MAEKYESQELVSTDQGVYGSTEWGAQTFTPQTAHYIKSVFILGRRDGSPGTITLSIRATDGSGLPTGSDLVDGSFNGNTLPLFPAARAWQETVLGSPLSLSSSTLYAIVGRAPTGDSNNDLRWGFYTSSGYANGRMCHSADGGATWTFQPDTDDFTFQEWGSPAAFIPKVFIM